MTFTDFKNELYELRRRKRMIRSILKSLANIADDNFAKLNAGVSNYSADRVQMSHDPDNAIITAIDKINRETERLTEKLKLLNETNEKYEDLVFSVDGIHGEILRKYFVEGLTMRVIAEQIYYSEQYSWELLNISIKELYDKEVKDK